MKMTAHNFATCLWSRVGGISRYGLVTAAASTR